MSESFEEASVVHVAPFKITHLVLLQGGGDHR